MELEIFKTQFFDKSEDKSWQLPIFEPDVPALVERLRSDEAWRKEPLSSVTLSQTEMKRSVLVTLSQGTEIRSRQKVKMVIFQVFEGVVLFESRKDQVIIKSGQRFVFREKGRYKITAHEGSILLITLLSNRKQPAERLVIYN